MMNKTFAYASIVMSLVFVGMAVLLAFFPKGLFESLGSTHRYLFAFLLTMYGIFRFYRAYKVLKPQN